MRHYAGEVEYDVTGFLDKNNDMLHPDLSKVMAKSSLYLVVDLFKAADVKEKDDPKAPGAAASPAGGRCVLRVGRGGERGWFVMNLESCCIHSPFFLVFPLSLSLSHTHAPPCTHIHTPYYGLPSPPSRGRGAARGGPAANRGRGKAFVSVGGQFKEQLNDLMTTLRTTSPYFIRCIKPNPEKV